MTDAWYAGVDAGASRTVAVVGTTGDTVAGRGEAGPGALLQYGADAAARTIAEAIDTARRDAKINGAAARLVVGATGTARDAERRALIDALRATGIAQGVEVTTDAAIALEAAFGPGPGIVLIAGTGSIAYGRDEAGSVHRTGGVGWRFGDEGSGYWLGREAVAAVLRAADGRGQPTALSAAIPCDAESMARLRDATVREVAALASHVTTAAREGDAIARELVERAAEYLSEHVRALATHFPTTDPLPVALAGGLHRNGSPIRHAVAERLQQFDPSCAVSPDVPDAAAGALRLAARH